MYTQTTIEYKVNKSTIKTNPTVIMLYNTIHKIFSVNKMQLLVMEKVLYCVITTIISNYV